MSSLQLNAKFNFILWKQNFVGGRVKRSITTLNNDCRGKAAKIVFGIDSGKSCNHLKMCET